VEKFCEKSLNCEFCGQQHEGSYCARQNYTDKHFCINCKEKHSAYNKRCPKYLEKRNELILKEWYNTKIKLQKLMIMNKEVDYACEIAYIDSKIFDLKLQINKEDNVSISSNPKSNSDISNAEPLDKNFVTTELSKVIEALKNHTDAKVEELNKRVDTRVDEKMAGIAKDIEYNVIKKINARDKIINENYKLHVITYEQRIAKIMKESMKISISNESEENKLKRMDDVLNQYNFGNSSKRKENSDTYDKLIPENLMAEKGWEQELSEFDELNIDALLDGNNNEFLKNKTNQMNPSLNGSGIPNGGARANHFGNV
jgi:hypothetical protein